MQILKRELSKMDGYATIIGMMVGSGIFVAIGEGGKDAGPSAVLAYLLLGPVTFLFALPYIIFQGTSLGERAGGAYLHISRTFGNHYIAFIVMWLNWLTYLGVLSVLSISVGRYLGALVPALDERVAATACLIFFYLVNLLGTRQFGLLQRIMFYVLIVSVIAIVAPGLAAVKVANFTPFMPNGLPGFLRALPILFFAYAGFDALSQTAAETEDARSSLPRTFVVGIFVTIAIYVCIATVAFGTYPFGELIASQTPLADAARTFMPFGAAVVTVGALMAFLTTINACMMAPSRILYAFAEDRVAPAALSRVSERFKTPHVSLTINLVFAVALVWTKTVGYLIGISMQSIIILYAVECAAMASLPFVNEALWKQVQFKIGKRVVAACGGFGILILVFLYFQIPNPVPLPLVLWVIAGTLFYLFERRRGKIEEFDYRATLVVSTE